MNFDKFKEINDELSITLQESDLNYARLILPTRNSEVAVVGKYAPKFLGDCYFTLNKQLDIVECDDFDEFGNEQFREVRFVEVKMYRREDIIK